MADLKESQLWEYRARIICSLIGLIAGLIWVLSNFWRALAFVVCITLGYLIGKRLDQHGTLRDFWTRIFPPQG